MTQSTNVCLGDSATVFVILSRSSTTTANPAVEIGSAGRSTRLQPPGKKRRPRSVNRSWLRRPNPHAANQSSDRRLTAGGLRTLWPGHPVVGHPIGRHDRLNALRNGLPRRRTWARKGGRCSPTYPRRRALKASTRQARRRKKFGTFQRPFRSVPRRLTRGRTKQQVVGNYPSKARGRPRHRKIQRA
jgi:hypothetical protein